MENILLISHYTPTGGMLEKLYNYLERKHELYVIQHPLFLDSGLPSSVEHKNKRISFKILPRFQYFLEGVYGLFHFHKLIDKHFKASLAICFDPLSYTHTYILRHLFKVDKIVYYNLDFSTRRFPNRIMNFIYQRVNLFAYRHCDYFFCPTDNFVRQLDKENRYNKKAYIVKHFVETSRINNNLQCRPSSLVYAGGLGDAVSFYPLLDALKRMKEEKIDFVFDIYGDGEQKGKIKEKISDLALDDKVFLKGVVKNKELIKSILPAYMIGVSPYTVSRGDNSAPDHMFNGTDLTSKQVEYIAVGLPIISTNLYKAMEVIENKAFGFLVTTSEDWYLAIEKLLSDEKLYRQYQSNALIFSKQYDAEIVLGNLMSKVLDSKV